MYSTVRYPRALRFTAENRLLTLHEGGGQPLSPVGQDAFQIPFDHQRDSGHRFEPPGSNCGSQSHPPLSARGLAAIMGFEFSRGFCRFSGFQSDFPFLHHFGFFGGEAGSPMGVEPSRDEAQRSVDSVPRRAIGAPSGSPASPPSYGLQPSSPRSAADNSAPASARSRHPPATDRGSLSQPGRLPAELPILRWDGCSSSASSGCGADAR